MAAAAGITGDIIPRAAHMARQLEQHTAARTAGEGGHNGLAGGLAGIGGTSGVRRCNKECGVKYQ